VVPRTISADEASGQILEVPEEMFESSDSLEEVAGERRRSLDSMQSTSLLESRRTSQRAGLAAGRSIVRTIDISQSPFFAELAGSQAQSRRTSLDSDPGGLTSPASPRLGRATSRLGRDPLASDGVDISQSSLFGGGAAPAPASPLSKRVSHAPDTALLDDDEDAAGEAAAEVEAAAAQVEAAAAAAAVEAAAAAEVEAAQAKAA